MENPTEVIHMSTFKPMLAQDVPNDDFSSVIWPKLISRKYDGVRCIIHPTLGPVSRSLKPIPNNYIRDCLNEICPTGLEGELIVPGGTFQDTISAVMTEEGYPEFEFLVFDHTLLNQQFEYRLQRCKEVLNICAPNCSSIRVIPHTMAWTIEEAQELFEHYMDLEEEVEGIVLKDPCAYYKFGRASVIKQEFLRRKIYIPDVAIIVGFEEQMENLNPQTKNELGYSKRTTHKANKRGKSTLGALIVDWRGKRFNLGNGDGLNAALRQEIWDNQERFKFRSVTFRYQSCGTKDLPRGAQFVGFLE
jgi:DNA ligase 1